MFPTAKRSRPNSKPRPSLAPFRATYTEAFADVTLLVECASGFVREIPAHRAILCRSEYFAAMFAHGLREEAETKVHVYPPVGVSGETVYVCIRFLYGETPAALVSKSNALQVLRAADFFLLAEMLEWAVQVIKCSATLEDCVNVLQACDAHVSLKTENIIVIPPRDEVVSVCKDDSDPFWTDLWEWSWKQVQELRRGRVWNEVGLLKLLPNAELLVGLLLQDNGNGEGLSSALRNPESIPKAELDAMFEEVLGWCKHHGVAKNLLDLLRWIVQLDVQLDCKTLSMDFHIPQELIHNMSPECSILNLKISPESPQRQPALFGVWRLPFKCGCSRDLFYFLAMPALAAKAADVDLGVLAGLFFTKIRTTVRAITASGDVYFLAAEEKPTTHHIQPWIYPKRQTGSTQEINLCDERLVDNEHVHVRVISEGCTPLLLHLVQHHITENLLTLSDDELAFLPEEFMVEALKRRGAMSNGSALFDVAMRWASPRASMQHAVRDCLRRDALPGLLSSVHFNLDGRQLLATLCSPAFARHRAHVQQDVATSTDTVGINVGVNACAVTVETAMQSCTTDRADASVQGDCPEFVDACTQNTEDHAGTCPASTGIQSRHCDASLWCMTRSTLEVGVQTDEIQNKNNHNNSDISSTSTSTSISTSSSNNNKLAHLWWICLACLTALVGLIMQANITATQGICFSW